LPRHQACWLFRRVGSAASRLQLARLLLKLACLFASRSGQENVLSSEVMQVAAPPPKLQVRRGRTRRNDGPSADGGTVTAVGSTSFLAGAVRKAAATRGWRFVSHRDVLADPGLLHGAGCVVNFALSPTLRSGEYDPSIDIDLHIARAVAAGDGHMVMMSSR